MFHNKKGQDFPALKFLAPQYGLSSYTTGGLCQLNYWFKMLVFIHSRPCPLFKNLSLFIALLRVEYSSEYMRCHAPFCLYVYLFDPGSWVLWRFMRLFRSDVCPLYSLQVVSFCNMYTQYCTFICPKKKAQSIDWAFKIWLPSTDSNRGPSG